MRNHHRRDPAMRPLRWMFALIAVGFVGLGLSTTRADERNLRTPAPAQVSYRHEALQDDANMTQQMSTPNAATGSQAHLRDQQLARSRDAGYMRQLEQHQADIERMLARAGR